MQHERSVKFKGRPLALMGSAVSVGQQAPDVTLIDNDLQERSVRSWLDRVVIVSAVPSLDTPVCDTQTRTFNQEVQAMGGGAVVLTVSMDLPFAQKRWCGQSGLPSVVTLSDHRDGAFGLAYGVLVKALRLLARSVFVLDTGGVIRYIEIVPELTNEPDYAAAIRAAADLVG